MAEFLGYCQMLIGISNIAILIGNRHHEDKGHKSDLMNEPRDYGNPTRNFMDELIIPRYSYQFGMFIE